MYSDSKIISKLKSSLRQKPAASQSDSSEEALVRDLLTKYLNQALKRLSADYRDEGVQVKYHLFNYILTRAQQADDLEQLAGLIKETALVAHHKRKASAEMPRSWKAWLDLKAEFAKTELGDVHAATLTSKSGRTIIRGPKRIKISDYNGYLTYVKGHYAHQVQHCGDDLLKKISARVQFQALQENPLVGVSSAQVRELSVAKQPLLYGDGIYSGIADAVRGAKSEILIKQYKIEDNATWHKILAALKEASDKAVERGEKVQLKVLVNKPSGLGGAVKKFKSKAALARLKPSEFPGLSISVGHYQAPGFGVQHAKFVVVDNATAISSSADPYSQNDYVDVDTADEDIDRGQLEAAMVVYGDVSDVRQHFKHIWQDETTRKFGITADTWRDFASEPVGPRDLSPAEELETEEGASESATIGTGSGYPVRAISLAKRESGLKMVLSAANMPPAKLAILTLLHSDQQPIVIATPNLNDRDLRDAIAEAVNDGKDVTLYLPKYRNDLDEDKKVLWRGMGGNNVTHVNILMAKIAANNDGMYPENMKICWVKDHKGRHSTYEQDYSFNSHVKFFRAGDYVMLGSTNWDTQSTERSEEHDLLLYSPEVAKHYTAFIEAEYVGDKSFAYNDAFENGKAYLIYNMEKLKTTSMAEYKDKRSEIRTFFNTQMDKINYAGDEAELAAALTDCKQAMKVFCKANLPSKAQALIADFTKFRSAHEKRFATHDPDVHLLELADDAIANAKTIMARLPNPSERPSPTEDTRPKTSSSL